MLNKTYFFGNPVMKDKIKILSIDDDKIIHKIIRRSLDEEYELSFAESGDEGVNLANDLQPDIIILDVEMEGLNGYQVCETLKKQHNTSHIPVLFLSSLSDLKSRIRSFEAGGADFLIKPFEKQELLSKLRTVAAFIRSQEKLKEKAAFANETAYAALRGSSDLGLTIGFVEKTYHLDSIETLANTLLTTMSAFQVNVSVLIKTQDDYEYYSNRNPLPPLEKDVLRAIHASGERFKDFNNRTQVNFPNISMLIKNMPLEDEERYGRYKDVFPTILAAADAKIHIVENEMQQIERSKNLINAFDAVRRNLEIIGTQMQSNQVEVLSLLKNTFGELEVRIPHMGLDDDQEAFLNKTLDTAITSSESIIDGAAETRLAFDTIIRLMRHLMDKQNKLLMDIQANKKSHLDKQNKQSLIDSTPGDIHLF